jgi:hypothetical protein
VLSRRRGVDDPNHDARLICGLDFNQQATFARYSDGTTILQRLFANVRVSLLHGLQLIFFTSAVIMCAAVILNILLKDVKLGAAPMHPSRKCR